MFLRLASRTQSSCCISSSSFTAAAGQWPRYTATQTSPTRAPSDPPRSSPLPHPSTTDNGGLRSLAARGLIQSVSSKYIDSHLSSGRRAIYLGVDPTAASLHIGHLVPILAFVHLVRAGHRGVLLLGGATASIGDPSGKTSSRPELDSAQVQANVAAITAQLNDLLERITTHLNIPRSSLDVQVLNNADFYDNITVIDFLRDIGRFSRMGDMLTRDSVKSRLPPPIGEAASSSAGLSFTEFTYQLLQAYDFFLLNGKEDVGNCTVQIGGSDQMGNIIAGVELIRRKKFRKPGDETEAKGPTTGGLGLLTRQEPPAFALTLPLLTTSTGEKLGKSAGNAVFLSAEHSSDYDYFQYFLRTSDEDVPKLIKWLTFLPDSKHSQTSNLLASHNIAEIHRLRQKLAKEVTLMTRGKEALDRAVQMTSLLHAVMPSLVGRKVVQLAVEANKSRQEKSQQDLHTLITWEGLIEVARQEENQSASRTRRDRRIQIYRGTHSDEKILGLDLLTLLERVGLAATRSEARRELSASDKATFSLFNVPLIHMDPRSVTKRLIEDKDVVWFDRKSSKKRGMLFLKRGKKEGKIILFEL